MSLTDIPGKIIERQESFNEIQLTTSLELTKLFYQSNQPPKSMQEILRTFFLCYNQIKEISPPPLDKIKPEKQHYALFLGVFTLFIAALLSYYYFYRWPF